MSKNLEGRVADIMVGGAFPFRDNPRVAQLLDDVGRYVDGVKYWQRELGMDAPDRLDRLPPLLNEVLSIFGDDEEKATRGFVETNFLRLIAALRHAGHEDVNDRLPQLIEDLKVIGRIAPQAHYARPSGPNSAPSLIALVAWLADFWEAETGTQFAGGNWKDGEAPNRATYFVKEVVGEYAPSYVPRLPTVTRKVAAKRKAHPISK